MSVPIAVAPAAAAAAAHAFHGSPLSLKTTHFQNRFYPAGSPAHDLGPIAMPDFRPASWDSPWLASSAAAARAPADADDLCRNYVCCGVALPDLHALVEHFEARHVEVIWNPFHDPPPPASPASDPGPFDPDDMDISEPSPSPPPTPAQSAFDPVRVISACFRSSYSSLAGACGPQTPPAFNRYAGYADYSSALPGTHPSPAYLDNKPHEPAAPPPPAAACVPPALLFSSSASPSPLNTPASSRACTPAPVLPLHPHPHHPAPPAASASASASAAAQKRPALTLAKPFRCPKAGCNKSYKQQNGLKYHLSHGQCNFAPRDPAVDALSEAERERRLRPFVCAVGAPRECGRRYKNMNGLRYHYTHTGAHGARGLEMLAQGAHPLPDAPPPQCGTPQPQPPQQQQPPQRYLPPVPVPAPVPVPLAPSPLSPFPRAWGDE